MTDLTIEWANIKGNPRMPTAKATHDINLILADAKKRGAHAVGFTEIAWPDYFRAIKRAAKANGFDVFRCEENVICFNTAIGTVGGKARHFLSKGVALVSPNRTVASGTYTPHGSTIAYKFNMTHWVSRWGSFFRRDSDHAVRQNLIGAQQRGSRRIVNWQTQHGFVSVFVGDVNGESVVNMPGGHALTNASVGSGSQRNMQGWVFLPAGLSFEELATGWIKESQLNTDHPAAWSTFRVTKAS